MSQRYTKHLTDLISKGWFINTSSSEAIVSDDFGQFFTDWPHNDHLTMSTMNLERHHQLLADIKGILPAHLLDSSHTAGFVAEAGAKTFDGRDKKAMDMLGLALALYMPQTSAGKLYELQFSGTSFGFMAIMYPTTKKYNNFMVRPSVYAPLTKMMSTNDAMRFAQQTMEHDRAAGKKEYFKHIKKSR